LETDPSLSTDVGLYEIWLYTITQRVIVYNYLVTCHVNGDM